MGFPRKLTIAVFLVVAGRNPLQIFQAVIRPISVLVIHFPEARRVLEKSAGN